MQEEGQQQLRTILALAATRAQVVAQRDHSIGPGWPDRWIAIERRLVSLPEKASQPELWEIGNQASPTRCLAEDPTNLHSYTLSSIDRKMRDFGLQSLASCPFHLLVKLLLVASTEATISGIDG